MKSVIVLLFLGLGACSQKPPTPACAAGIDGNGPQRLIAFGDSQTFGAKSQVDDCDYSWAFEISKIQNMSLVMNAVPGSKFTDDDEGPAAVTFAYQPSDTVMMLIGFNDMMVYGTDPTHLQAFQAQLTATLMAVSPQVSVVVIGTCLHPYKYEMEASPEAVEAYREATKQVVSALNLPNVIVVDVDDMFAGQSEYYRQDDGIHILPAAQTLAAAAFTAMLPQ